jgi:Putative phage tail protein/Protein of unknown function (DUF2793)
VILPWVWFLISTLASIALAPKPPKPKPASLEDFDVPTAEEDRPIPVLFGTKRITGANVVWYGDLSTSKIKKGSLFGSSTIGYRYYMGFHLVLGHGPWDVITRIEVADREAWAGSVTANGEIEIDAVDLFGGNEREGGMFGTVDVCLGGAAQTANAYLEEVLTGLVPAYRRVVGLVWRGHATPDLGGFPRDGYIGNSAYLKPWAVTGRRILAGWHGGPWYPSKAAIGTAMNPAHVIYQCLTDPEWGMGASVSSFDDVDWQPVADTLHTEGLGLNLLWNQQSKIEDFVSEVLDTIDGILVFNLETGKYELRLIRGDYDPETLPIFDAADIRELSKLQWRTWGETVNELVVTYTDPDTQKPTGVTLQDLANIEIQGRVSEQLDLSMLADPDLVRMIGGRKLAQRSTPVAQITFTASRRFWQYQQGQCVRIEWPPNNLPLTVFRVMDVVDGPLEEGVIEVEAVQDIYSLTGANYTTSQGQGAAVPYLPPPATDPDGSPNVLSRELSEPPSGPADGDRYFIPAAPPAEGVWTEHELEIAEWDDDTGEWIFTEVQTGVLIYDEDTGEHFLINNEGDVETFTGGGAGYPPQLGHAGII